MKNEKKKLEKGRKEARQRKKKKVITNFYRIN